MKFKVKGKIIRRSKKMRQKNKITSAFESFTDSTRSLTIETCNPN